MAISFLKPNPTDETTNVMLAGFGKSLSPQKVYVLGLQQIVIGDPPEDDLFVGWRYVAGIGPDVAIATLINQQPGGRPSFTGLTGGPQTAKAVRAAEELEKLPKELEKRSDVPPGTYEVRLLSVPGLLTDSFWLRWQTGRSDWVVPFDTVVPGLKEKNLYSMNEFLGILRPPAEARSAADAQAVYRPLTDDSDPAAR